MIQYNQSYDCYEVKRMIEKFNTYITPFKLERRVQVYLPKGYYESNERYPVIYMFDGHNLFFNQDATYGKSWGLQEFMDQYKTKMIIIGVECNHVGNERSQNRAQYSGNTGHGYGQSYITLGHKGNYVGGGTAGAGADQNNACSQSGVQAKGSSQKICQARHNQELGASTNQNISRTLQNKSEVLQVQRSTHTEHYNAQQAAKHADATYFTQYPQEILGHGHTEDQKDDGDDAKKLTDHCTDLFHWNYLFPLNKIMWGINPLEASLINSSLFLYVSSVHYYNKIALRNKEKMANSR